MIHESVKEFLIEFEKILENSTGCIVTSHSNTDFDGFATAFILNLWIQKNYPQCKSQLIFPEINKIVKNFIDNQSNYKDSFNSSPNNINKIDTIILVDTNDPERSFNNLPQILVQNPQIKLIIIDHHIKSETITSNVDLGLIKPSQTSAAEIMTKILLETQSNFMNYPIEILLLGIISDTGHFKHANADTFQICKIIMERQKIHIGTLYNSLFEPVSQSERIAMLKAATRISKIHNLNGILIVFSHLSSFEAEAAKKLIKLGADVSFIINFTDKDGKFRISARSTNTITENTSIHLGTIMEEIGLQFSGSGGGHKNAAGCYGIIADYQKRKKEKYVSVISQEILKFLSKFV